MLNQLSDIVVRLHVLNLLMALYERSHGQLPTGRVAIRSRIAENSRLIEIKIMVISETRNDIVNRWRGGFRSMKDQYPSRVISSPVMYLL